jgi:hypothetical protein
MPDREGPIDTRSPKALWAFVGTEQEKLGNKQDRQESLKIWGQMTIKLFRLGGIGLLCLVIRQVRGASNYIGHLVFSLLRVSHAKIRGTDQWFLQQE